MLQKATGTVEELEDKLYTIPLVQKYLLKGFNLHWFCPVHEVLQLIGTLPSSDTLGIDYKHIRLGESLEKIKVCSSITFGKDTIHSNVEVFPYDKTNTTRDYMYLYGTNIYIRNATLPSATWNPKCAEIL